jgi:hypothetical protein
MNNVQAEVARIMTGQPETPGRAAGYSFHETKMKRTLFEKKRDWAAALMEVLSQDSSCGLREGMS